MFFVQMEAGLMQTVRSLNRSWIYDTYLSLYRAIHLGEKSRGKCPDTFIDNGICIGMLKRRQVLLQSVPRRTEETRQSSYQPSLNILHLACQQDRCLSKCMFLIRPAGLICKSRRSNICPTKISILHDYCFGR